MGISIALSRGRPPISVIFAFEFGTWRSGRNGGAFEAGNLRVGQTAVTALWDIS